MDTGKSMARNAAAMMVSQGMTWASTLLLTIYLPRMLGAADFGKLQFALALTGMFAILVDFGTTMLITREVARDHSRAPAYLSNTLALKLGTAVVAFIAVMATARALGRPPEVLNLVMVFGIAMGIFTTTSFLNSFLQGFEQVHYQAWGLVIEKAINTALVLALLFAGFGLTPIAWAMLAAGTVSMLWSGFFVLRLARPSFALLSLEFMRDLVKASLPFFMFAVFAKIYDKIDVAMLAAMTSDTVVGWYAAAYRLFESLFFLPHIFNTVTFPVLSRLSASDPEAYARAVHRGFAVLAAAAVGVCVPLILLAGPVVDLLYSNVAYPGTAPTLRILALALGCMYLNTMFVMVLVTSDRQGEWMKAGAVAALINPAVNYLLIPWLDHLGAAITTVITEAMLLGLALRACPRGIIGRQETRALLRSLLAGVPLTAGLLVGLRWGVFGAVLLGMPLYLAAILRLGVVSRADLALMASAFTAKLGRRKG